MKKIFYLASIAALAFSSCAKDETTEAQIGTVTGGIEIVAAMESNETRTQLVENGNGGFEIVWNGEDALLVYENVDKATETVYPLAGARFGLKGGSDGTATGSFFYRGNGNVDALSASQDYVAFYPSVSGVTAKWNGRLTDYASFDIKNTFCWEGIKMQIPAEQTYEPKSFAPGMVPAISKEFTVNADGTATVQMQPMVDYLMVEVKSTEPIETAHLALYTVNADKDTDGTNNKVTFHPIAGDAVLNPYTLDGANVRYFLSIDTAKGAKTSKVITLNTNNLADNTSMKDANTYVFTIPGNMLGTMGGYNAVVWFNDAQGTVASDLMASNQTVDGINTLKANKIIFGHSGTINGKVTTMREWNGVAATKELENGIFWFNKADNIVKYTNDYFLIEDELDLFKYFSQYNVKGTTVNGKSAYVVEDTKFDLTAENMKKVLEAAVAADELDDTSALAGAIHAYVESKGKFPTISTYNNVFKGNGASIVDIDRPLASADGLFGTIGTSAEVNDLNLSGLVAATVDESGFDYNYNGKTTDKGVMGYILAKEIKDGAIDNITVADLTAEAVIGKAAQANWNELTIGEAGVSEELVHLIADVTVKENFKISAADWAKYEALGAGLFHKVTPDARVIAYLPEGAKYEDFTSTVTVGKTTPVLSVLAGNVSYWTGGSVSPEKNVKQWNNDYSIGNTTLDEYSAIQYAEELAGAAKTNVYLVRNLDLNGSNDVNWAPVALDAELYGNDKTISNLGMEVAAANKENSMTAPFTVKKVSKLTINDVNIAVDTSDTKDMTQYISGLANGVTDIYSVKMNNLNIEGTTDDNALHYNGTYLVYVGWFTAKATNITIVNSDVVNPTTNINGYQAMVAKLEVNDSKADDELEAIFQNSNISGITPTIDDFAKYNDKYFKGSKIGAQVALVSVPTTGKSIDLSFRNCGTPVFNYTFNGAIDAEKYINVSYDYAEDVEVKINYKGIVED